ncbi:hypothetical protein G7062_11410 [Erysipelothrix sp. HDW6C]|uniref:hypothetical protein n=1 Tax=Erysipelothrix sp. HDW6C TaxID=2714930 RepID=UPI001407F4A2|nr:hypothetical protein [Erysipelothrix sp. HDW6C]QIK70865.1 hypothetical protein G7062_11410 [Erysipelothrix sp. HDW6C]
MKLIGKLRDFFFTDKDIVVTFTIGRQYWKSLNKIDKERLLDISINDKKSQRTLEQNRMIWALIHEIDKHENGSTDKGSEMELYKNLIKNARIQIDYLQGLEQTKESLSKVYRVVEIIERRTTDKADTVVFGCYRGTSQFDKEEMSIFIEVVLSYAEQIGLGTTYYVDELTLR